MLRSYGNLLLFLLLCNGLYGQSSPKLAAYLKAKQFVALDRHNTDANDPHYYFYKAVFANVCNQPELSNRYLDSLELAAFPLESLFDYWELRNDNYVKSFAYRQAFETSKLLNTRFRKRFKKADYEDSVQAEKICEGSKNVDFQDW